MTHQDLPPGTGSWDPNSRTYTVPPGSYTATAGGLTMHRPTMTVFRVIGETSVTVIKNGRPEFEQAYKLAQVGHYPSDQEREDIRVAVAYCRLPMGGPVPTFSV
jgi:hypothetical protein